MRFSRVGLLGLLLLSIASFTWSQTGTSTIRGTITDPQGRVVSGANVTLTNTANNAVRTTKSTDAGIYIFDLITPGDYKVEIDARGFKKQANSGIHALIGKPVDIDVKMEVVPLICRIDTLDELDYFRNGGILQYVLRQLAG